MSHSRKHNEKPLDVDEETDFAKEPLSGKIGDSLRKIYKDVVEEPVPDDFLAILKGLDN